MKLKVALAVTVVSGATLFASAASSEPPDGVVPPHRHFVIAATGELQPVGPDACANGPSRQFDNFHTHIHRGQPFANGIISAKGC